MRYRALLILGHVALLPATELHAQQPAQGAGPVRAQPEPRATTVYRLFDGRRVTFDVKGLGQAAVSHGSLEIEYKNGHALIRLQVDSLVHPQRVGPAYTAYAFWGVTGDGKVIRLGELPSGKRVDVRGDITAQTVGVLATAEPYAEVELPSPELVLSFVLVNAGDKNAPLASSAQYRGDSGRLNADTTVAASADFSTPLLVQSARHAVAIARRAGAVDFAPAEWRQVDVKLGVLEQIWPEQRNNETKFSGLAREVIRLADAARRIGAERADSAAAAAERAATAASLARAASDVETARRLKAQAEEDAARARAAADSANQAAVRARAAIDSANQVAARARAAADSANLVAAQTIRYADSVRAAATAAAAAATAAQQEAIAARRERDSARARLASSIGAILDTKREARGLVVNLSDVLFASGSAVLEPGAREKLSRLSGILLAYPGPYTLAIGGHTDSVGSDALNDKLSQARAESVRSYLLGAGIAPPHVTGAVGYGKRQPVADNGTVEGRARNRRVEIVIDDADSTAH
jgi:outer membrane protein OmpA-like peptidoglycan-associated protein